jgi:hypothetical protein
MKPNISMLFVCELGFAIALPNLQNILAASKLSEAVFSKVWDNPEDAAYDNL